MPATAPPGDAVSVTSVNEPSVVAATVARGATSAAFAAGSTATPTGGGASVDAGAPDVGAPEPQAVSTTSSSPLSAASSARPMRPPNLS